MGLNVESCQLYLGACAFTHPPLYFQANAEFLLPVSFKANLLISAHVRPAQIALN